MPVFSTMMCKRNGTVSAVVYLSPNGTNARVTDSTEKLWAVDFSYGTIHGAAACNSLAGTANTANTGMFTYATDHGVNCWCAMQKPISSYWVYYNAYNTDENCADNCALKCAQMTAINENDFRYALMNSIW